MSARGQVAEADSPERARELGYAQAMSAIVLLAEDLTKLASEQANRAVLAGTEPSLTPMEKLGLCSMAAMRKLEEYARSACLLAAEPALAIDNGFVLDGGFYQTWYAMFGETGGAS